MVWIYGASGHGKVILDILKRNYVAVGGFIDDNESLLEFMGYPVVLPTNHTDADTLVIFGVGSNSTRRKLVNNHSYRYGTAIHPSAVVSDNSIIGEGCVMMALSVLQSGCRIGRHVIVNTGAMIDHDCQIDDFAHISPGATLCGNVAIGNGTWIGAGTTIIQGVNIGENVIIGAGSVIRKNVPSNIMVAGNPPRILKRL